MAAFRDDFRQLIKLEELREKLLETNAFEDVSLMSYPESWKEHTKSKEEQPKSIDDMEPRSLDWPQFDTLFEGKWHLLVGENTEPLPDKYQSEEGYRDLFGPEEDLDEYKHLPKVYCKRAQPLKIPRKPKQRLPFPVYPEPEDPGLTVKPWMLEPNPPKIDWSKQYYKGLVGAEDIRPLYVRWEEYPVYEVDNNNKHAKGYTDPTLKEMVLPYLGKKAKKGLLRIPKEEPEVTQEDINNFFEEKERKEKFENLLIGEQPDNWWEDSKDKDMRDFRSYEVVGGRAGEKETIFNKETKIDSNPFIPPPVQEVHKEYEERKFQGYNRGGGSWKGKGGGYGGYNEGYDQDMDREEGGWERRRGPRIESARPGLDSWAGKGAGASGWNRFKVRSLPRTAERREEGDAVEE